MMTVAHKNLWQVSLFQKIAQKELVSLLQKKAITKKHFKKGETIIL